MGLRRPLSDSSVLIAGGGPVGLAAAVELGRRGIDCLVLEPRAQVSMLRPRAKTTSVRTMEHFRRWRLAGRIRDIAPLPVAWSQEVVFCTSLLGQEITRIGDCFGLTTTRVEEFAEAGQQIPQPLVEQVLRDAIAELPAVTFAAGWSLVGLEERASDVVVQASGPGGARQSVCAAYVLGCEGAGSPTRAAIGSRYQGDTDARPNFNIVFRAPGLAERVPHGPAIHYWVVNRDTPGLVGRMDLAETWWTILMGVDTDTGQREPRRLIQGLIGAETGMNVDVISTDPWTARMLLADAYQTERVFLVGDAAHLNPPWGGHGFNTGIGDAVNVGWKLAATLQGWGGPDLPRSYAAERRPIAQHTIDIARANMSVLSNDLTALIDDPEAVRRAKDSEFHSLGGVLGYSYDNSPIVVPDGTPAPAHDAVNYRPSARPGARLPHTWLPDGCSLYDVLGADLTLVQLAETVDAAPLLAIASEMCLPVALVNLSHLRLAERYAATLLLVRPDQHVAWRSAAASITEREARTVLQRVIGTP